MFNRISADDLLVAEQGWHVCRFHFSYEEYRYPDRDQFGVLSLLNDDTIQTGYGYDMHPHQELEIISYCVSGEFTHRDSLGNHHIIKHGDVQYISAGSGLDHSLISSAEGESLRLIQMWILPDEAELTPLCQHNSYQKADRHNRLLQVISNQKKKGTIQIHQDANIYVSELDRGRQITLGQVRGRQFYLLCLEGILSANGNILHHSDALGITAEESLSIEALEDSHLLLVDMAESDL